MTEENHRRKVIRYYDENAHAFYDRTVGMDMSDKYDRFLAYLKPGSKILDAGCGSGRDSLFFLNKGYDVTSMDGSVEMVRLASELIGQPALHLSFYDMDFSEVFDAVWASASLLHVPRGDIKDVINRMLKALKPGGIFYMSFKHGNEEKIDRERFYNFYDEGSLTALLNQIPALALLETWQNNDPRPGRGDVLWLNAITQK